ncbi:type II 3-dehydroquinate dehydratase [Pseudobacteriovorax antillogorgiicola]|uniref:3-dehydroquinate dehydratase n=1 Tax=Pseudobacteriovorax antillogorgiicola TaxID=1513793 RepID=A0A1Y6B5I2_9BACT|nr:type II 3-dehydroquinate dehydratase [Pseudobacteriovorax antillogorgiicola]TCS58910.1 3-dehydroquinate dehydratase [Pseudobacteriovorax antillogorgiicola]SME93293.1 3-dehydroquinate dehydratase [Pseudobacteriovorax antillogorgiicola]
MKHKETLKILVASGVNLDLLGKREPEIYGHQTLDDVHRSLKGLAERFSKDIQIGIHLECFQTNHEGVLLDKLSEGWDGVLINPGAWTHTSLALADRLAGLAVPFVEVHISNISRREAIRKHSHTAPIAVGVTYGFGVQSYHTGLFGLIHHLQNTKL